MSNEDEIDGIPLTNYTIGLDKKDRPKNVPIPPETVWGQVVAQADGWPKVCQGQLFVPIEGGVRYLNKPADLYAWLALHFFPVDWAETKGCMTKAEFFGYAVDQAERIQSIEPVPHEPLQKSRHYIKIIKPNPDFTDVNDTKAFHDLLEFFKPATAEDEYLLASMILTPFWGGDPGTRPAFIIDSMDGDEDGGVGVGKTALTDALGRLCGGMLDLPLGMAGHEIRKAIINSSGIRIIRFDNVKSSRFSSAHIEAMITSHEITGHKMFHGSLNVLNNFTWVFTINSPNLSKDLAKRSVIIKLDRPTYDPHWHTNLNDFITDRREDLYQDIVGLLRLPEPALAKKYIRFARWQSKVLGRLGADPRIVDLILARQEGADDDKALRDEIEAVVDGYITEFRHTHGSFSDALYCNPDTENFLIHTSVMHQWIKDGVGYSQKVRTNVKLLERIRVPRMEAKVRKVNGDRFYCWRAKNSPTNFVMSGWKIRQRTPMILGESSFYKSMTVVGGD